MTDKPVQSAFLPGSFDPPHGGHLGELISALRHNVAEKVALVIVRPGNKGAPLLSPENSAGLLRLMIADSVQDELLTPQQAARIAPIVFVQPGAHGEAGIEVAAKKLGATVMLQGLDYGIDPKTYAANIQVSMAKAGVPKMHVIFKPRDGRASSNVRRDLHNGKVNPYDLTPGVARVLTQALEGGAPRRTGDAESPFVAADVLAFNARVSDALNRVNPSLLAAPVITLSPPKSSHSAQQQPRQ
jgi:hypothetical protein